MATDTTRGARVTSSPRQIEELQLLLVGYRVSQAIHVVARLGIADLLADRPMDHRELASATRTDAGSLYRVLRFLAGVGLFEDVEPRCFGLTRLGAGLRRDVPGSRRPWALMLDYAQWQAWGDLLHSVQTGEPAFNHVHGIGRFEYLRQHPEYALTYQEAMTGDVEAATTALTDVYDFSGFARVVDVGGGQGAILATVLQACATTRGVLFDRPEVVAAAGPLLEKAGVAERCEIIAGDFFTTVPPAGDAYILRQIIHDWPDRQAVHILRNCRAAMPRSGRVLVVERAIAADLRVALPVLHTDMSMLVHLGGRERSEAEHRALFAEADLRLTDILPLGDSSQFSVFEGVAA